MKYKVGDEFLVKIKLTYAQENNDTLPYRGELYKYKAVHNESEYELWFTQKALDAAEKLEPTYEEEEYYWVKIFPNGKWMARLFYQGEFRNGDNSVEPSYYCEIGPKIERPKQ